MSTRGKKKGVELEKVLNGRKEGGLKKRENCQINIRKRRRKTEIKNKKRSSKEN